MIPKEEIPVLMATFDYFIFISMMVDEYEEGNIGRNTLHKRAMWLALTRAREYGRPVTESQINGQVKKPPPPIEYVSEIHRLIAEEQDARRHMQ